MTLRNGVPLVTLRVLIAKEYLPLEEGLVRAAVGEAGAAHAQILHQPQVFHLVGDQLLVELHCWGSDNIINYKYQCTYVNSFL